MYSTLEEFRNDALACGASHYPDKSLSPERVEVAYRIYSKISQGTKIGDFQNSPIDFGVTIVGRLSLRSDNGQWVPSDPAFPSIDQIMRDNLSVANEGGGAAGSILDSGLWSLLANDAWLLGGIHALTEFHFASPLRWANLWSDSAGRMSVTAREAIGIFAFGYRAERPYPQMEAVATCVDRKKAAAATLVKYRDEVIKLQARPALQGFFDGLPAFVKV